VTEVTTHQETHRALKNAVKLSMSLGATLLVAISVRFWLPRVLGPQVFGQLHFAESLALALFLFTTLGVDVYIRKEVATRPEHASEFFGGLLVVRVLASMVVFGIMAGALTAMGKGRLEWQLALGFGVGQVAFVLNQTLAAVLHARGTVNELSILNPISKILWGTSIVVGLLAGGGPVLVAIAFAVTEWLRAIAMLQIVRRRAELRLRVDLLATKATLLASAPYFVNFLAHRVYERIDVQMLTVMTNDQEVGWYGASVNLATAGLLLLPVVSAVVLPMGARLAAESKDEMDAVMRRAVRLIVVGGALFSIELVLHAPSVVQLAFGDEFGGSVRSLQVLAPMFPLTYIAVITSMHLIQLERIWTVTLISLGGLLLNPALNLFTIPWGFEAFGAGGGGIGAAVTTMATEGWASGVMLIALGRAGVDRRLFLALFHCVLLGGLVYGIHVSLEPLDLWRVPVEVLAYGAAGVLIGAIPLREILDGARATLKRRAG
jgi:O-antigen/teichoic acid export membrane protein